MTFKLSDYPVLARIATGKAKAKQLDDRACRWLYTQATSADLRVMSPEEHRLRHWLMENAPACHFSQQLESLQTQVRANGFRRMADEQAFLDDMSGDI